jgi:hypothetical protein
VIGEVYEQMDSMLGQIKDILQPKDAILYDHIHKLVVKRWDNLNVQLHALAYVHPKILFFILVGPIDTERGVNQYQVQFKTFFNLYLNHSIISNEQ